VAQERPDLEEGKIADVIATATDPLKNIAALRQVSLVMKGGRIHKQNGISLPLSETAHSAAVTIPQLVLAWTRP
jgi:hypothetical protein